MVFVSTPDYKDFRDDKKTEMLISILIYSDREMHLDVDENIFQKLEYQVQEFIKGDLMESSQKMGRWG